LKHGLSISKAYLADIASNQERQSVLGMFNACSSFGFIFGPLISGYLADRDPTLQLSVLTGAGVFGMNFVLVAVLLPSMPLPVLNNDQSSDRSSSPGPDQPNQVSDREQILNSLHIFRRIHVHWWQLLDVIIIQFLLTFSSIIFKFSFVVFMDEQFHVSGTTLGQILSFNGLASALGSATSGRISKLYSSNSKQVAHFTLLLALSLTCLTFAPNIVCIVLLLIPLSLSSANMRICLLSLMLQRGKAEEKGAIIGLANSISSISRMLAPSIVGVSQEYSIRLPGYLSAVLALAASCVALIYCWDQDGKTNTDKSSDSDTY
jgi:predicted MFS family arabinose efflux permease